MRNEVTFTVTIYSAAGKIEASKRTKLASHSVLRYTQVVGGTLKGPRQLAWIHWHVVWLASTTFILGCDRLPSQQLGVLIRRLSTDRPFRRKGSLHVGGWVFAVQEFVSEAGHSGGFPSK